MMLYGAMNFPVNPVLDEIEEIASLGFDYLELAMDPPLAHYSIIRKNVSSILKALDTHSLQLVCHLPTFVSTADLTESIRKASVHEMLASLEVAAELGALKVIVHPGHIVGLAVFVMDTALKYAMESLTAIMTKADHLGLYPCLENMFPKSGAFFEAAHFADVFERFPHLKMTLDIGHANINDKEGHRAIDFFRQFGQRIGHIHISDNRGKRDDHLPVGEGTIDFTTIVKAIRKSGYNETATLEIFSEDRNQLKSSRKNFAAMLIAI